MKTTKRQFKLFCDEFNRHCERFGLQEWRLDFFHEDCGDNFSEVAVKYADRVARVSLNTQTTHVSDGWILETALHEAVELLVMDLYALANDRFVNGGEIDAARHTLVRRLERLL